MGATESKAFDAVVEGDDEWLRRLVGPGVNVNWNEFNTGYSLLHMAAARGHAECVSVLLEAKAFHNLKDNKNNTPLHLAITNRAPEKVLKNIFAAYPDGSKMANLDGVDATHASKGGGAGGASAASPANQCVCHVGNLSWSTTDDTLLELFSGYGEVVSAEVQICVESKVYGAFVSSRRPLRHRRDDTNAP